MRLCLASLIEPSLLPQLRSPRATKPTLFAWTFQEGTSEADQRPKGVDNLTKLLFPAIRAENSRKGKKAAHTALNLTNHVVTVAKKSRVGASEIIDLT